MSEFYATENMHREAFAWGAASREIYHTVGNHTLRLEKAAGLRELLLACARRFESIQNEELQDVELIADLAKRLRSYAE